MEPLANAISLGRPCLGFHVFNSVDCQMELIVMTFNLPTAFRTTICQNR